MTFLGSGRMMQSQVMCSSSVMLLSMHLSSKSVCCHTNFGAKCCFILRSNPGPITYSMYSWLSTLCQSVMQPYLSESPAPSPGLRLLTPQHGVLHQVNLVFQTPLLPPLPPSAPCLMMDWGLGEVSASLGDTLGSTTASSMPTHVEF